MRDRALTALSIEAAGQGALGLRWGQHGQGLELWGPERESPMGRCEVRALPAAREGELPVSGRGSQWPGWHRADPPHLGLAPRSQKGAGVLPSV